MAKKEQIQKPVKKLGLRYLSINVLKFSQFDIGEFEIRQGEDVIEYQASFESKINSEKEEVIITTTLNLKIIEIDDIFCELKVASKFGVSPFENGIKEKDGKYLISESLLANFTAIIMGTLRGILHEKLKGTVLQNEVLPLIDLKAAISNLEYT